MTPSRPKRLIPLGGMPLRRLYPPWKDELRWSCLGLVLGGAGAVGATRVVGGLSPYVRSRVGARFDPTVSVRGSFRFFGKRGLRPGNGHTCRLSVDAGDTNIAIPIANYTSRDG